MKPVVRALVMPLIVIGTLTPHLTTPVAAAEPYASSVAEANVTPPITFGQLGLTDRVDLIGANQPADVSVPVPSGVAPTLLSGQIGAVVNIAGARVDVRDARGTALGSIVVPADTVSTPFTVDITRAEITDGNARLRFVLRDNNAVANSCTQPAALTLSQLSATFSGPTPNPTTVAGFLPGYLDQILIRVGPRPSQYTQQAALDLVAELTHLYRPMPVRIDVAATVDAPSVGSTRRVIELREGGQPGTTVENPGSPAATLAISGSGEQLIRQVALFADARVGLAQRATAVTLSARNDHPKATTIKTFGELRTTGETSVLGMSTLYAGFDATAFGVGPISDATVHLKARYTPVSGADASVLIRSGATVLASRTLDESGVLDISGTVPAETVTSNVGLALELRYFPHQECAPLNNRMTFAIDPQSTVSVTPGTVNRGGFPVLPMAFSPAFDVAIDTPEHIGFAAQAINLMGQQTTVTLRPHVTTFADAARAGTGLLAVTRGDELAKAGMNPPVLPADSNTFGINGRPDTEVDLNGPLGVVQAFTDNNRMVLAITGSGDWSLVDTGFDHIRGLPDRWASVTGDVVATGAARETVNLTVNEGGPMAHQPAPGAGWRWWAWSSLAAAAAAVVAAGVILVARRRSAKG